MTKFNIARQSQDKKLRALTRAHWAFETLCWALVWIAAMDIAVASASASASTAGDQSPWQTILFYAKFIVITSILAYGLEDRAWERLEQLNDTQEQPEKASR